MPSHSEAPYVRGASAWLLSAGPRRLFQVTRRKGGTNSRRYPKNGYVPNPNPKVNSIKPHFRFLTAVGCRPKQS
jgi:hypothetical protein